MYSLFVKLPINTLSINDLWQNLKTSLYDA